MGHVVGPDGRSYLLPEGHVLLQIPDGSLVHVPEGWSLQDWRINQQSTLQRAYQQIDSLERYWEAGGRRPWVRARVEAWRNTVSQMRQDLGLPPDATLPRVSEVTSRSEPMQGPITYPNLPSGTLATNTTSTRPGLGGRRPLGGGRFPGRGAGRGGFIRIPRAASPARGSARSAGAAAGSKAGLLGALLAAVEGGGVWFASKLPSVARGPATRLAVGAPRVLSGLALWFGETAVTLLSAPIVIAGAKIMGVLIIVGGVIYYMLPDGRIIPLSDTGAAYGVVLRQTPGFDGGDVLLEEVGDVDEFVAAKKRDTGYDMTVVLGPYASYDEARQALCDSIVAGTIEGSGTRYAQFTFDGNRWGLPTNPCEGN